MTTMFHTSLLRSDTQLNRHSYYEASVARPPASPALDHDTHTDVVVVGGGFAGLSAAIELADRGMRVVLLEAERIGYGASGRNGGQAIVGYASGQGPFEAQLGRHDARLAWDMSLEGIDMIHERMQRFAIDCDWVSGYLYVADSARKARQLLEDVEAQHRDYGFACETVTGADVSRFIASPRYQAAAYEQTSGHLHPLKYALGLARAAQSLGVTLHEYTPAMAMSTQGTGVRIQTAKGTVNARFAVIAGNCMLPEVSPNLARPLHSRIMPVGTYIIGTAPMGPEGCRRLIPSNAAVCDNNVVLDYFRFSADHRMLFGGRVSYTTMTPPRLKDVMRDRMVAIFPDLHGIDVDFVWGGFVDISMNRAPDFGRLAPHVYYLQGFSGHGVAATGLAGRLVAEAIKGQASRFDVFARLRHAPFPGGRLGRMPALALGMWWHRLKDALG